LLLRPISEDQDHSTRGSCVLASISISILDP
jgi:hypothetical protein